MNLQEESDTSNREESDQRRAATELRAIPKHVAIIMDGNGRWARRQNLPRTEGHRNAVDAVKSVVEESARLGVEYLTLYAFSTENWNRPKREVDYLMRLLKRFLVQEEEHLMKNNIVLQSIGRTAQLPGGVRKQLAKTIENTSRNTGLITCLALNYGGRAELSDAMAAIARDVRRGVVDPENVDEEFIKRYLYQGTEGRIFPDPDLMIRTAGEMRLSNFLLWQAAYAEFYSTSICWPDFRAKHLREAIAEYGRRTRKFGGLKDDKDDSQSSDRTGLDNIVCRGNAP